MNTRHDIAVQPLDAGQDGSRHVAVVPGAEVPLLTLELPVRLRGAAREEVARRQLRDRLGAASEDVELRPFFAEGGAEAWHRALVADTTLLANWRAQAGPGCQAVLPDYLALPAAAEIWSIRAENGSVQARLGLDDGFSADPELALLLLDRALESNDPLPPKAVFLQGESTEIGAIAALMQPRGIALVETTEELAALGLPPPERFAHGEMRFDLRADPQAAHDRLRRRVLPWRWPMVLGLLATMLWATAHFLAVRALERELAAERAATLEVVRGHFVPVGPVLDVRNQVAQALETQRAMVLPGTEGTELLALFARAAGLIADAGVTPEEFSYDQKVLTTVLRTADFAGAEALVKALRDNGLGVEVVELRAGEGASGVRAELRLKAEP